jgi:hypothetical protein
MKLTAPTRPGNAAASVAPGAVAAPQGDSYAAQLAKASDAKAASDFAAAQTILQQIYDEQTSPANVAGGKTADARVIQELALATYKAGEKRARQEGPQVAFDAYAKALDLLRQLDPDHTTDPETLGLWAAVHKRRAESDQRTDVQRARDLDIAIGAAERGFVIRRDYYTGVNYAYLLDYRASRSSGDDRLADRILASRVRRRVVDIAKARIAVIEANLQTPDGDKYKDELYWTQASLAEALIALDDPQGPLELEKAKELAPKGWMLESTQDQIERIRKLRT